MPSKNKMLSLRSLRTYAGLTQRDISFLLSYQDGSQISQLENGNIRPSLRTVLAYQVLFRVSPAGLYPSVFNETGESVRLRAKLLADELEEQGATPHQARRIVVLRAIASGEIAHKRPLVFENMKEAKTSIITYEQDP